MIDGIDGSGKSTIIQAFKDYLSAQGNAIFDLKNYWKNNQKHPELSELKSYDFIFSAEPTNVGVGQAIRQELINDNYRYPTLSIAQAYALDRLILYTKLLIPTLQQNKIVIQDRGVTTSLAYQPAQDKNISLKMVAELEGNKLALDHAPNHLIIVDVEAKNALARLDGRDKKDKAIFEKLEILEKNSQRFHNQEFVELMKSKKTAIQYLNANQNIDIMKAEAIKILKEILL